MGTMSWPPPGNCTPVLATASLASSRLASPKPLPGRHDVPRLGRGDRGDRRPNRRAGRSPAPAPPWRRPPPRWPWPPWRRRAFCLGHQDERRGTAAWAGTCPPGLPGLVVTCAPGISAESSPVVSPTASTLRGCRSLISRRAARVLAELADRGGAGLPRKETMLVAVADNGEDSSNGACAFSASGTAAATDAGLSLATTTLDAHPSSEFATSAASSAGEPERTGRGRYRLAPARRGGGGRGCR